MADVQYTPDWPDPAAQCQKCQSYQVKNQKSACVPPDKTFEQAIEEYGEVSPVGHCNCFRLK